MDGCSSGAAVRVRHQLLAGCKQVPTPPPFPSALGPSHAHTRLTPLQLYGELQRGLAVLATNGKQVQPHEVMDTPTTPGPAILVVDCPDLAYLAALQAAEQVRWAQRARGGGHLVVGCPSLAYMAALQAAEQVQWARSRCGGEGGQAFGCGAGV